MEKKALNILSKAISAHQIGMLKEAEKYYLKAIALKIKNSNAYSNLAALYLSSNKIDKALNYFEQAIAINSNQSDVYYNLGILYKQKSQTDKAIENYLQAINLNPNFSSAYTNLGSLYQSKNKFDKAQNCYLQAIKCNPENINTYFNLASLYLSQNNLEKAKAFYKKTISIKPNHIDALYQLSLIKLLEKNYKEGFKDYRYRYHQNKIDKLAKILHKPTLLNPNINILGKTILVNQEQGFGDSVQFIRFIKLMADSGAKIVYQVQPLLLKLYQYNFPSIKFISEIKKVTFNYNFPIMDSAYILGISYENIPHQEKYIEVDKKDAVSLSSKLNLDSKKLKIGINYQGSTAHRNDKNRSIDLELLLESLKNINAIACIYSIQYQPSKKEEALLNKYKVENLGKKIQNFYDTALLIENMDLVITVDTSVAHLSGAMGKSTYVLLPYAPDWRWGLEGDKTNWYKSVTLLRQGISRKWNSALKPLIAKISEM